MTPKRKQWRWGVLYRYENKLSGKCESIVFRDLMPKLFLTREQARKWIASEFGYIARRKDLREEPHGLKMPIPVKIYFGVEP